MRMNKGVSKVKHKEPKASQAHVSRKRKRLIHESRTCCVMWCSVMRGTVENLNML